MKRKRLISIIVAFAIIELIAVFIGVIPFLFNSPDKVPPEIRVGIFPEVSKEDCRAKWSIFFDRFKDEKSFRLVPYYANSYEEAIQGFIYGSLDLLYINAAVFARLQRDHQAKALVYHKIPEDEADLYRSALVGQSRFEFFAQTKGARLTFTNRNSMTGGIVPLKYLKNKLKGSLGKWFSNVDYSRTEIQGLDMLKNKETELLAVNLYFFRDYLEKQGKTNRQYNIIWVSSQLPEPVICVSKKSKYYNSPLMTKFKDKLYEIYRERVRFNRLSLLFETVDYDYNSRLQKLEKFLYEDKNNRSSKSILMGNEK